MEAPTISTLLQKGKSAFASGDLETAEKYFNQIVMADPAHVEALNNLGVIAFHQCHYDQAIACFEKALQQDDQYKMAIENLSKCYALQGWYAETIDLYQKAFTRNLFSPGWLETMTRCFILLNDLGSAQTVMNQLNRMDGYQETGRDLADWINLHKQTKHGDYARRSWCRTHASLIRDLESTSGLNMIRGRFWEYPFVFEKVMERPNSRVIDIGMGDGHLAALLARQGHQVVGVDIDASSCRISKAGLDASGLKRLQADARNLEMVSDNQFDTALLISVIEHIPSNTIWCEKRQTLKTGVMLREEIPEKVKAIREALRVVKPEGRVILTSDIYLDYPADMNISWKELLGLEGIDRGDFNKMEDLYITDNPIHKGRGLSVAVVIEKKNDPSPH
jgi:2-polyprenyl-3-methyl-5-hydroxy-6-metoxy-1,4-benzoquinol methylase